jgi:hypothetical protein
MMGGDSSGTAGGVVVVAGSVKLGSNASIPVSGVGTTCGCTWTGTCRGTGTRHPAKITRAMRRPPEKAGAFLKITGKASAVVCNLKSARKYLY